MRSSSVLGFALAPLLMFALAPDAEAAVTRLVVTSTESPVFAGRTFQAGQYELVHAKAYGELDPHHWLNERIVNLDKAPRNANGKVEYSVDVDILKPIDLKKGSHTLYFDIPNRGSKVYGLINSAAGATALATDAGTGFLMDQGYTIVSGGWQGDIAPAPGKIGTTFPIPHERDGSPVHGLNRDEFSDTGVTPTVTLNLSYPAYAQTGATLTVREREHDARVPVAFTWVTEKQITLTRPAGFDSGALYEFIYEAKDPTVMGIGFAAMRDVTSYLRNDKKDSANNANPLLDNRGRPDMDMTLVLGVSQTGRVLKDFLWQGFNEDERGRRVFDGINPHISGGRKASVNLQFGQPGRNAREHQEHLYPGDQFPFTYGLQFDWISGRIDGIMLKCRLTNTCPKVMHTDSELEIFQTFSSLVMTDTLGHDYPPPDDVRVFQFSGTQHTPAATSTTGICQFPSNTVDYRPYLRALTVALDKWVRTGKEPPESRVSTRHNHTLVTYEQADFPQIPGFEYAGTHNVAQLKFFDTQPPHTGGTYVQWAPDRDADGNTIDGLRGVAMQVPIATSSGYNVRRAGNAEGALCDNTGSYFAFPRTVEERYATDDDRPSLQERYRTHADYVKKVKKAIKALQKDKLLLDSDAEDILTTAEAAAVP